MLVRERPVPVFEYITRRRPGRAQVSGPGCRVSWDGAANARDPSGLPYSTAGPHAASGSRADDSAS
ncbi:hypothetical protein [Actinomadura spongiicola]|uniref:hypothetical protein n=1 Tax=Actinomadura spongiicola TaxID=2303421 RepID=UPI0013141EE7|nr:hypothetical protein [Actinomadura spongiicola]